MSHKITGKEPLQKPCGCNTQDVRPSKLDQMIAEYKAMKAEAEAARDTFIKEALDFQFVVATEAEIYEMFNTTPPTPPSGDGYINLSDTTVGQDGYIPVDELRTDEDMYVKAIGTFVNWKDEDFIRLYTTSINSDGYILVSIITTTADGYIKTDAGATDSDGYLVK